MTAGSELAAGFDHRRELRESIQRLVIVGRDQDEEGVEFRGSEVIAILRLHREPPRENAFWNVVVLVIFQTRTLDRHRRNQSRFRKTNRLQRPHASHS